MSEAVLGNLKVSGIKAERQFKYEVKRDIAGVPVYTTLATGSMIWNKPLAPDTGSMIRNTSITKNFNYIRLPVIYMSYMSPTLVGTTASIKFYQKINGVTIGSATTTTTSTLSSISFTLSPRSAAIAANNNTNIFTVKVGFAAVASLYGELKTGTVGDIKVNDLQTVFI